MVLDYSQPGLVQMSMIKNMEKIFADFPDKIWKQSSTPSSDHLYPVRDPQETDGLGKFLPEEEVMSFLTWLPSCC